MADEFGREGADSAAFPSPQEVAEALVSGGVGIWKWHHGERRAHLDSGGLKLLGLQEEAGGLPVERLIGILHPEDAESFRSGFAEALHSSGAISQAFRLRQDPFAPPRWLAANGNVVERDAEGAPMLALGVLYDVTKHMAQQEAANLLTRELAHRMKNLLSVVGSIATVSAERRPEAQGFVTAFQARLNSLAAAHELLREAQWRHAELGPLAEKVLAPVMSVSRIEINANGLILNSYDSQTLVLVLHELATNAVKYGALSQGGGKVKLSFEARPADGEEAMQDILMVWRESGGPAISAPRARGFGITLLERLAKRQGSQLPVLEWHPEGLVCRILFRAVTV
jgi:two-component sensor histidine kinase